MTERERWPERPARFETLSGIPVEPLYTPESLAGWSPAEQLGRPGEYPFTRGVYPTMYRGRLWTMRMFAGFGRPEDHNARFKYLLAQGQTGLSTAFDMPALMGHDADHPGARGEVGKEGVSISTLDDFERLFADIPLGDVTTSMTINCTASVALAMYLAIADKQGVAWSRLGGTMQNDMLKELIAQEEWVCPPDPAVRIVTDMIEVTSQPEPRFNPGATSGYPIREAGSPAVRGLAFTLADGGRGHGRPAQQSDPRRGDGRGADRRSAGRLLLSGEAHRPDGGGRAGVHRAHRRHGRHGAGHRRRLSAEGDRGCRLSLPAHG